MNEKTKKPLFKGVATALITPFKEGTLDLFTFRRLINLQISANIDALVVCGTTGEAPTLSEHERDALLTEAVKATEGKVPVIMGCGSNDTAQAVRYAKRAKELGADATLVVTPYYNKGTKRGLYEHFLHVAEGANMPMILYNVPSRTGVDMTLEDYDALLSHPLVCGVKEASASIEKISLLCRLARGRASVYTGNDALLLPSLSVGADGVISVASCLLPKNIRRIFGYFAAGETELARASHEKLLPLFGLLFEETNPSPIKHALSLSGLGDGSLRLPLSPPSEGLCERIRRELSHLSEGI